MKLPNPFKIIASLFLLLFSILGFSSQTISVENNGTYKVKISSTELTRITVDGGRVKKAWAMNSAWDTKADKDTGELFIKPKEGSDKPVSFFVQDSSGGTYTLIATPLDIPSETIVLKSADVKKSEMGDKSDQPYVAQIKALVRDMSLGNKDDSMVEEIGQVVSLWEETELWLVRRYTNANLVGEEYSIANKTKKSMTFTDQEFGSFGENVRGVAIEKLTLRPNEITRVFIVRRL